jgi:hypothetical protein
LKRELEKENPNQERIGSFNYGLTRALQDLDYQEVTGFGEKLGRFLRDCHTFRNS